LDQDSVIELKEHVQLWVVPLGIKQWLIEKAGVDPAKIVELKWWQQVHVENVNDDTCSNKLVVHYQDESSSSRSPVNINHKNSKRNDNNLTTITCCPASHWASRTMADRNFRLWCSFAFGASNQTFFFCGDTSYPDFPLFRQIGDALGPFDLAAIPIGAYKPTEIMKDAHVDPWEAVRIHKDLRSKQSIGIHWGTFALSEEGMQDPPRDLQQAMSDQKEQAAKAGFYAVGPFVALEHGKSIEVSTDTGSSKEEELEREDFLASGV
jgi:N-acyl-phosphatidylethanolamine-hydrolysing phospholipase D